MKQTLTVLALIGGLLGFSGAQQDNQNSLVTPIIVAHPVFLNQSAPILSATLFTPTSDGDFRVSAYLDAQTSGAPPGQGGGACVLFSWTDDFGQQIDQDGFNAPLGPKTGAGGGDFIIHVKANTPIQMDVNPNSGCTTPPNYNVFVTVERLPRK